MCLTVSKPHCQVDETAEEAEGDRRLCLLLFVQAVECLCQERNGRRRDEEHKSSIDFSLHQVAEISSDSSRSISEAKHRRQRETNQLR